MASYIGIDLGTTYSAVAHIDDTGRPTIVHNSDGENITPSCVMFEGDKAIVGEEARLQLIRTAQKGVDLLHKLRRLEKR
jgi:molecular chaperone DnaK